MDPIVIVGRPKTNIWDQIILLGGGKHNTGDPSIIFGDPILIFGAQ